MPANWIMAVSVAMLYRSITLACRSFSLPSFLSLSLSLSLVHVFHSHGNKTLELAMRLFRDEHSGFVSIWRSVCLLGSREYRAVQVYSASLCFPLVPIVSRRFSDAVSFAVPFSFSLFCRGHLVSGLSNVFETRDTEFEKRSNFREFARIASTRIV